MSNTLLRNYIKSRLSNELPSYLTYHSATHTLDVTDAALRLAQEMSCSAEEINLLEAAALLHDCGYLISPQNHEELSCQIASELLPQYGFTVAQIAEVHTLIMATQLPQSPKNKLSEILCDADLDYLGRDDYASIAHQLFLELKHFGRVTNEQEWLSMQIHFLENHQYFTDIARRLRQAGKELVLRELKNRL
jgi:predicted metal-dependent HD superfamily phosphohydrolase